MFDEALITEVLGELETTGVLPAVSVPAQRAESNPPAPPARRPASASVQATRP